MNKVFALAAAVVFVILFTNVVVALQQSIPLIGVDKVWAMQANGENITGKGQVVCVIDSGIDYTHPDLGSCSRGQFLAGNCDKVIGGYAFYDNVTSDKNDIMDNWGHGTHVAGIMAANGNIKGVAPDAKIVGVKACSPGYCDDSAVLEAFNWCLDNQQEYGITIISMSVGHDIYNRAQCDSLNSSYNQAFATARARGIPVIVASGNDGATNGLAFPACLSNTIAVGATTKNDGIAGFSDRNSAMMSLLAPGQDIISTWRGGIVASMSGTSQATPHVAGTIALLNQILETQGDSKSPQELETLLIDTGKSITDGNGATYKRIDALAAAQSLFPVQNQTNTTQPVNNTNQTNNTNPAPLITDFTLTFIVPNDDQIIRSNNFTASAQANTTLDSMDVNLDGGPYYHACDNCNSFTVPVDRLQDGQHTLNLIGSLGTVTKNITVNFIVNTTIVTPPTNNSQTNQTQQNETNQNSTNTTQLVPLIGFSIVSPNEGEIYNNSVTVNINVGNANIVNYSIDNGLFVTYSAPATIALSSGSHNLTVRASTNTSFNQTSVSFSIINTTIVLPQNNQSNVTNSTNNTNQNQTNSTNVTLPNGQNNTNSTTLPGNSTSNNQTNQNSTNNTGQTPAPQNPISSNSGSGGGGGGASKTTPKKNAINNTNYTVTLNLPDINAILQNLSLIKTNNAEVDLALNVSASGSNTTDGKEMGTENKETRIKDKIKQFFRNMITDFNNLIFKVFKVGI